MMEVSSPTGHLKSLVTDATGAETDTAEAPTIDRQGYRIGELQLVIRFEDASELATVPPISRLPGAPEGIQGLANLHGNIVPVADIAQWLGVTHDPTQTPMLLVCGYGEEAIGIIIDGLPERKKFPLDAVTTLDRANKPLALFSRAAYLDSAGIWVELDDRLLFSEFLRNAFQ